MSRCVAKALCGLVTTRQPNELTLANPLPAMGYTRCCEQFYYYLIKIIEANTANINSLMNKYEIGCPKFNVQPKDGNLFGTIIRGSLRLI